MKKYLFLAIFALALLSTLHTANASTKKKVVYAPSVTYPAGCTASSIYSVTTGTPCSTNSVASRQFILQGFNVGIQQLKQNANYVQAVANYNTINNDITVLNEGVCPSDMGNCGLTNNNSYQNIADIYGSALIYEASNMFPILDNAANAGNAIWNGLVNSFQTNYCDLNPQIINANDRAYCHSLFQ